MFELLIIALLFLANGFFALSELSIVSSRKQRLALLAEKRRPGARIALALAESPEQFLSAIQVGITLVGILAGAFGGAAFADDAADFLGRVPLIAPYSEQVSTFVIVLTLTYFSVVIGELVPKQVALSAPESWACLVAPVVKFIVVFSKPLVWLLSTSSRLIVGIMTFGRSTEPRVTEAEVGMVMREAIESGSIVQEEHDIAARALRLTHKTAENLMTPRTQLEYLRIGDSLEEVQRKLTKSSHSYLPLAGKDVDDIVGVIPVRTALRHLHAHGFSVDPVRRREELRRLTRPALTIPETATGTEAIDMFRAEKTHFAIVVDKYGGTAGALTNHDLLEALVGFIPGDKREEDPIVRRADGSLLVSGWVPFEEVNTALGVYNEELAEPITVAALVLSLLPGKAAVGQKVSHNQVEIEIVDLDGARIDKVLVTKIEQERDEPAVKEEGS